MIKVALILALLVALSKGTAVTTTPTTGTFLSSSIYTLFDSSATNDSAFNLSSTKVADVPLQFAFSKGSNGNYYSYFIYNDHSNSDNAAAVYRANDGGSSYGKKSDVADSTLSFSGTLDSGTLVAAGGNYIAFTRYSSSTPVSINLYVQSVGSSTAATAVTVATQTVSDDDAFTLYGLWYGADGYFYVLYSYYTGTDLEKYIRIQAVQASNTSNTRWTSAISLTVTTTASTTGGSASARAGPLDPSVTTTPDIGVLWLDGGNLFAAKISGTTAGTPAAVVSAGTNQTLYPCGVIGGKTQFGYLYQIYTDNSGSNTYYGFYAVTAATGGSITTSTNATNLTTLVGVTPSAGGCGSYGYYYGGSGWGFVLQSTTSSGTTYTRVIYQDSTTNSTATIGVFGGKVGQYLDGNNLWFFYSTYDDSTAPYTPLILKAGILVNLGSAMVHSVLALFSLIVAFVMIL